MKHHAQPSKSFQNQFTKLISYSPTVLRDFLMCPKYWKFKYLERRKTPPSPVLNFGIAFHRFAAEASHIVLVERAYKSELEKRLEECAQRHFQETVKNEILSPEAETEFLVCCCNTIPFFANLGGKSWEAVDIELRAAVDRRYELTSWRGAYLRGCMDLVLLLGNRAFIVDWKTGKCPSSFSEKDKLQLHVYSLLVFKIFEKVLEVITIFFYARSRKHLKLSIHRSNQKNIQESVEGVIKRIESEKMFRPRPGRHCNWCVFKDEC